MNNIPPDGGWPMPNRPGLDNAEAELDDRLYGWQQVSRSINRAYARHRLAKAWRTHCRLARMKAWENVEILAILAIIPLFWIGAWGAWIAAPHVEHAAKNIYHFFNQN